MVWRKHLCCICVVRWVVCCFAPQAAKAETKRPKGFEAFDLVMPLSVEGRMKAFVNAVVGSWMCFALLLEAIPTRQKKRKDDPEAFAGDRSAGSNQDALEGGPCVHNRSQVRGTSFVRFATRFGCKVGFAVWVTCLLQISRR